MIFHQIVRFYHRIDICLFIVLKNRIVTIKYFLKQRQKMYPILYFMIKIGRLYIFSFYNAVLNFIKYLSSISS